MIVQRIVRYVYMRFSYGTYNTKYVGSIILKLIGMRKLLGMKAMSKAIPSSSYVDSSLEEKGYTLIHSIDDEAVVSLVRKADFLFVKYEPEFYAANRDHPLITISPPEMFEEGCPIREFATSSRLIGLLTRYFGHIPKLCAYDLVLSPNDVELINSSQAFHLDGQFNRSVHVFIYITDVMNDCGPTVLIPASLTERLCKMYSYRKAGRNPRLSPEELFQHESVRRESFTAVGEIGTIFMFDGDRCLHLGGRKASNVRKFVHLLYLSPFSFTIDDYDRSNLASLINEESEDWKRHVVC